jgi:hypothetical protein
MDLTADQIKSNWDQFIDNIVTYISSPRQEKLLAFYKKYEDRFIMMPASHKPQYHNCFPGGYVEHVNRVVANTIQLANMWEHQGAANTFTIEEAVFSALNHDLGKFGTPEEEAYIEQTDQWRRDKLGEVYSYNDKLEFMSVPDRGLYLLMTHGIEFTKNEMLAIKLHDGLYDDANKPYLMGWSPETKPRTALVHLLHFADMMAARFEFEREWLPKFGHKLKKPNPPLSQSIKEGHDPKPLKHTKTQMKSDVLKGMGKNSNLSDLIKNL